MRELKGIGWSLVVWAVGLIGEGERMRKGKGLSRRKMKAGRRV